MVSSEKNKWVFSLHKTQIETINEAKQLHALSLKTNTFNLSPPIVSSRLLSLYTSKPINDLIYARSVFEKIQSPSLPLWNMIIKCHVENNQSHDAICLFSDLLCEFSPDNFTLPCVIKGCSRLCAVEEGKQIHGVSFKLGFAVDKFVQSSLVSFYSKSGLLDCARKVFDEMSERDLVTWNSLIDGYARCGNVEIARKLFDEMPDYGFKPKNATFTSLISAVAASAILSTGKWVHSYMIKNGIITDNVIGTLLIEMYSKCGSIESALSAFESVRRKKLGHWNSVIVGLGMHGMAQEAFQLFKQMQESHIKPNGVTFVGLLNACSHVGYVKEARCYFDSMVKEYGIERKIEHYGCLVDVLCRTGKLQEAKDVIEEMPMRPNKVILMSLLRGARIYVNVEIGEYAAHRLVESSPESHVAMSNMYAAAGKWDKVSEVREMMKKKGIKKDAGWSLIERKGVVHRFIVGDKSHPQSDEIYEKLKEMREKLRESGHVPDTKQVLLRIEEEKEKEAGLELHSERLAIAYGLINDKANGNGKSPIRVVKNLTVCNDCHSVTKLLSRIYRRDIVVRDNSRFHHFRDGSCSCNDFW
ncbi:unnamed protein product [Cochlearia groenlandica]